MITDIMIIDALRYMGMPIAKADEELKEKIRETFHFLVGISLNKYVYKRLSVTIPNGSEKGVFFDNAAVFVPSKDLAHLLMHVNSCYIIAATLGAEVDRQISLMQRVDMMKAVMLDACASVLIDRVCDDIEMEIASQLDEGLYLTMRYSPGYGDVSLELSASLLKWLQASKTIGLSLTQSNMLIPTKSVTALIGISTQMENRQKSCADCNLVKTCTYRKGGKRCGL